MQSPRPNGASADTNLEERVTEISRRIDALSRSIDEACRRAGREAKQVRIVGVAKHQPAEMVRAAAKAGLADIGENYAQELVAKQRALGDIVHWHFIGHLQRNKVREIIGFVSMIHSVDSLRLAAEISRTAVMAERTIPILLQVNASAEQSKSGVAENDVPMLAEQTVALPGIDLQGLMLIPAPADNPENLRPIFARMRRLRDTVANNISRDLPHLSMGMSGDFQVAVEEGATLVRVGTAIFGERFQGKR